MQTSPSLCKLRLCRPRYLKLINSKAKVIIRKKRKRSHPRGLQAYVPCTSPSPLILRGLQVPPALLDHLQNTPGVYIGAGKCGVRTRHINGHINGHSGKTHTVLGGFLEWKLVQCSGKKTKAVMAYSKNLCPHDPTFRNLSLEVVNKGNHETPVKGCFSKP